MGITKSLYGNTADGREVDVFTLTNSKGAEAKIINYGGTLVSLKVPDRKGNMDDVVLGYDNLNGYLNGKKYFGALIGRYGNRIGKGTFKLNGIEYHLSKNEGKNHLHGGFEGFSKKVWTANIVKSGRNECLKLSCFSKDGEEGYPGNLNVTVTYTFADDNSLRIDYYAVSDKDTVVNLTNHSYFNLSGQPSGSILNHQVMINADKFTAVDEESIPTGELRAVKGTPLDFRNLTVVGKDIDSDYEQIKFAGGFDHNFVLNVSGKTPEKAAEVYDSASGRVLEVYTTEPGVQFYTGNYLNGKDIGKGGKAYEKRSALCLETQFYPDSPNHENFPSPVLRAGQKYRQTTIYKFSVR